MLINIHLYYSVELLPFLGYSIGSNTFFESILGGFHT